MALQDAASHGRIVKGRNKRDKEREWFCICTDYSEISADRRGRGRFVEAAEKLTREVDLLLTLHIDVHLKWYTARFI